jgi:predicted transcriptional regulator
MGKARTAAGVPRSGLGITTKFVEVEGKEDQGEALRRRYRLLDVARRLLPENKRLQACMRVAAPGVQFVKVMHDSANGSAGFRGVCRCADGKLCMVCAAHLGEKKREELAAGFEANKQAGWVFMMTLTASHKITDDLADVMTRFDQAKREMRQAWSYRAALAAWGGSKNVKFVTAWELTWSPLNGWHYHQHILLFVLDRALMTWEPDAFEAVARKEWQRAAAKHGLTMNAHGFDFVKTEGAISDYITKWGHEPARRPWGAEDEATKAHSKSGRVVVAGMKKTAHITPMQMLGLLDEGITSLFGHDLGALFQQYAAAVKGKAQLKWSPGLRKALGLGKEKTDAELVEETSETSEVHGLLTVKGWQALVGNDARADLLEQVRAGADFAAVAAWLAGLGIRYLPPVKKRAEAA